MSTWAMSPKRPLRAQLVRMSAASFVESVQNKRLTRALELKMFDDRNLGEIFFQQINKHSALGLGDIEWILLESSTLEIGDTQDQSPRG